MDILKQRNGIALVQVDKKFYVVGIDWLKGQVTSVLHRDMPEGGGQWYSHISREGIQYVASPRTWKGANAAFYRASRDA